MDLVLGMVPELLDFLNVAAASVLVILAFSLLAYTLTYNYRDPVAHWFALLLGCVMVTYASEVALDRVLTVASANRWLRLQWLGIAMLPGAYYLFSLEVLRTTNYLVRRRHLIGWAVLALSVFSALVAMFGTQIVRGVRYHPPLSSLEAGPGFWPFALFYVVVMVLSLANVWKARQRCLTDASRKRMSYVIFAFVAPGVGIFPYLIGVGDAATSGLASGLVLVTALLVNGAVAFMLIILTYMVAYFGVLTPDRVVRYRLIRFFFRGPLVAIVVILAVQTLPRVETVLGVPRDIVLFSVITGVIVLSQLALSVTKSVVDRLVYREDREEIAWLRELDRRLLATTDLRQFLENNLAAACELLRVPAGFVAVVAGPDLFLEVVVGPPETRTEVTSVDDWDAALSVGLKHRNDVGKPVVHAGYWVWPLVEPGSQDDDVQVLGVLGVRARAETPQFTPDESALLERMVIRVERALMDRRLQQVVFDGLQRIIPDIERIQELRNVIPYRSGESDRSPVGALLNPSPIHSPEFEAWVKDALSHYWGGPKLTRSPLVQLRVVGEVLAQAESDPTKALRLVLGSAIERLRPDGKQNLSAPEWLLYNILEMRFIQGRKIRDIADRLAVSESDLYRKQRVAIGQVVRMLTEMEQTNATEMNGRAETAPETAVDVIRLRGKEKSTSGAA